jgi:hypothetical protein
LTVRSEKSASAHGHRDVAVVEPAAAEGALNAPAPRAREASTSYQDTRALICCVPLT